MKLYQLNSTESYEIFVQDLLELEQPIYIYGDGSSLVLVSPEAIEQDLQEEIVETLKKDLKNYIESDDEILYDDYDDVEDWMLWL